MKSRVFPIISAVMLILITYAPVLSDIRKSTFKTNYDSTRKRSDFDQAFAELIACQKRLKNSKKSVKRFRTCIGSAFHSSLTTTEVDLYANWLLKGYQFQNLRECDAKKLRLLDFKKEQTVRCSTSTREGTRGLTYIIFQNTTAGPKITRIKHINDET